MGLRGPSPKPNALRKLEGVPGHSRPLNDREPQSAGPLVKPDYLSGEAGAEWDRAVAAMPPGFYGSADAPTLAVYCKAWVLFRKASALVDADGISWRTEGGVVMHPALGTIRAQSEIILRATDKLGMSPGARARLTVPETKDQTKFGALLGGAPLRVATTNGRRASARSSKT